MSTELAEVSVKEVPVGSTVEQATHALHIKNVPHKAWCRARHNANLSGITYRDFVIRLLAECQPFPLLADSATPE